MFKVVVTDYTYENLDIVYGDNVFEKCGINRDEAGEIGKTRYFSGKRQHLRRERPAVYQQS